MKFGAILTFAALTVSGFAGEEIAWSRKPVDYNRCQKEGKSYSRCEKENADENQRSFESQLNLQSRKMYNEFSSDHKKMAMDYADNNRMPPNDAVAKVAKKYNYPGSQGTRKSYGY